MVPINSMPITHRKEVQSELAKHVWHKHVCILVLFVWVARLMTDRCRKCKLRDAVESLRCYFNWQLIQLLLLARHIALWLLLTLLFSLLINLLIR